MHTTIYIDIDEEITSIIDRMRKADVSEVIIVAPKNAMLLQSAVNLRLLKKEADRRKKQLLIITQDKIGKKLIEKAGIMVKSKPGNDVYLEEEKSKETYEPLYKEEAQEIKEELQKEELERKDIGTSDYFEQESALGSEQITENLPPIAPLPKKTKKKEEKKPAAKVRMSDIVAGNSKTKSKKQRKENFLPTDINDSFRSKSFEMVGQASENTKFQESKAKDVLQTGHVSIKKAEKFFRGARRRKKELDNTKISGSSRKYFAIFVVVFIVLGGISTAYFLLPKASLSLEIRTEQKPISVNITAASDVKGVNFPENRVPVEILEISKDEAIFFPSTGTRDGKGKASGKAVIYNEFSNEDHPLVATTRLETEDGKIFRITKNIVVPGMTQVGSEIKPGAIEVDIVADQPGDTYNIGPATFKIPGFQSNKSKYEKFYAKSVKDMVGGNSEGIAKIVTAQDIASAKEKISSAAKKDALEELKKTLPQGQNLFDESIQIETTDLESTESAGAEKEEFSIIFKLKAKALTVRENDIHEIIRKNLASQGVDGNEIRFDMPIDYLLESLDSQSKVVKFSARTDIKTGPEFNVENFKKGLLGKSTEEVQAYAKNFPDIEKMDISFWPFFVNRIPPSESRIFIEIK